MKFSLLFTIGWMMALFACKAYPEKSQNTAPEKPVDMQSTHPAPSDSVEEGGIEKKIQGAWRWYKTSCCFRMPRITYGDSLPQPKVLDFNEGTVKYFSGDKLTDSLSYRIDYNLMRENRPVIVIGDKPPAFVYFKDDTLVIDYGYMDLQTEYYLRK
ncbi:MAG: hypothetical protein KatS3mg031_0740 [Chitinophagales bacterium]|nr:MAG: hypothetical protein KatS3mg031_0740 [Chitinophagales bacterium]